MCVQPCGDIPINIADIVTRLVLTQVSEIDPVTEKKAAVIALKLTVQPTDDFPIEALQDALRR
jgi:hypothetical protein